MTEQITLPLAAHARAGVISLTLTCHQCRLHLEAYPFDIHSPICVQDHEDGFLDMVSSLQQISPSKSRHTTTISMLLTYNEDYAVLNYYHIRFL